MAPKRNTRSTRKGKDTTKDYTKLNEGSPLPDELEIESEPVVVKMTNKQRKAALKEQKQKNKKAAQNVSTAENVDVSPSNSSGDENIDELLLECDDGANNVNKDDVNKSENSDVDEEEDEELREAEKKLKELKKKAVVRLRRENRLQQIAEETKQLEDSLKASKNKKKSRQLTTAGLRSMDDVASKVDKLMDDKKLSFRETSGSETEQASDDDNSSPEPVRKNRSDDGKRKCEKARRSGKESKVTSDVYFPQTWPHSTLRFHYAGKEKDYDDLSLAEFCAGYMSILKRCKSSEKKARIDHLEELMYLATHKPWKAVLSYHGACLLEIERGNLHWGDNFQLHGLHNTILNSVGSNNRGNFVNGKPQQPAPFSNATGDEKIWFCKAYQLGRCSQNRDHHGFLFGEHKYLRHICGKCWHLGKKQSQHPETSDECPFFNVQC